MSRFYTFAATIGNNIHVRGWDDAQGGHFQEKVPFKPTLFLSTNKTSEYQTLDGRYVVPVQPGTIRDCRAFIDDYNLVDGASVFGMERFLYQYLSEEYDEEIQYDMDNSSPSERVSTHPRVMMSPIFIVLMNMTCCQHSYNGGKRYNQRLLLAGT